MSDVSPDSSVSNIVAQVVMPEFPFSVKLDPAVMTLAQAQVLTKYYEACAAMAGTSVVGSVVSGSDVSSETSGGSKQSRRRRRIRNRNRRRAVLSDASVVSGAHLSEQGCAEGKFIASAVSGEDAGWCYLDVVAASSVASFRDVLGAWPALHQLLSTSAVAWNLAKLRRYSLRKISPSRYHLVDGVGEFMFSDTLSYAASMMDDFPATSLAAVAVKWPRVCAPLGLVLNARVGGVSRADTEVDVDADGACYLKVVVHDMRRQLWDLYGPWPTFDKLLDLPVTWIDFPALSRSRLVRSGSGKFHVCGDSNGALLASTLAGIARGRSVPGRLSAAVESYYDSKLDRYLPSAMDLVGGNVDQVVAWLRVVAGLPDAIFDVHDLAVVSSVAANLSNDDKQRLRLFEASGDCALSMAVATRCLTLRLTAQKYQEARASVTGNANLARHFVSDVPSGLVQFPAGVDPSVGKAGANSLEAMFGIVYDVAGMPAVVRMCHSLRMFDDYAHW